VGIEIVDCFRHRLLLSSAGTGPFIASVIWQRAHQAGEFVASRGEEVVKGVTVISIERSTPTASPGGARQCSTNRSNPSFSSQISTTRKPTSVGVVR
jgi:hypothetical protein